MEGSGAEAGAGVETMRGKGGGIGAETRTTREAGSVQLTETVIATDKRHMTGHFPLWVMLRLAIFGSDSSVMQLDSCVASGIVINWGHALLVWA